jgi:hypothetical protein
MSKINDALQRAKNAQQKNSPPSGVTPMRPIEEKRKKLDLSWVLPVVAILLVVVAVFFIAMSLAKRTANSIVAAPEVLSTQQVETVVEPVPTLPPPVIGPGAINVSAPAPAKIQGIAYDPVHPWAIVSGKTVYVGDSVDGMIVLVIAKNSVTLAGGGQTNKLYVGQ